MLTRTFESADRPLEGGRRLAHALIVRHVQALAANVDPVAPQRLGCRAALLLVAGAQNDDVAPRTEVEGLRIFLPGFPHAMCSVHSQ